jgi:putative transposase
MYPSSLSREQWKKIEHLFIPKSTRGRKSLHDKMDLLNAVLYVVKGGIQWRMMPTNLPPWKTVYTFFRRMCLNGVWEKVLDFLNKECRRKSWRTAGPSIAIIDSQSTKTQYNADHKGYDGGKKNQGKKKAYRSRYYGKSP